MGQGGQENHPGNGFPAERVLRFNAPGPEGLLDGKAPGKLPLPNVAQPEALAGIVEAGPVLTGQGVLRWRIADLVAWLHTAFEVKVSPQTPSRDLRAPGPSKTVGAAAPPCPGGRGDCRVQRNFPAMPAEVRQSPPGTPAELWWQEFAMAAAIGPRPMAGARVGQKTGMTRRRAKRGTRPSAPEHQRTASACSFGAICPAPDQVA